MNPPPLLSASRILLVDDCPDTVESMSLLLKFWGYQSLVAFDGITGLNMALSLRPDAIFLDIRLSGMDGNKVARRIREEPGMEKTPLLALTGCGMAWEREASLAAGFDRHLLKPVDPEVLRQLLAVCVPPFHTVAVTVLPDLGERSFCQAGESGPGEVRVGRPVPSRQRAGIPQWVSSLSHDSPG